MRRLTIGLSVVVMVLLFASVAGAVPPDPCKNPANPHCTDPPSSTTMEPPTTTTDPAQLQACPTGTFTITGKAMTDFECLWTPINDAPQIATVTVSNITGAISGPPVLFVRDDSPGDICVLEQGWDGQNGPQYIAEFDLYYDEVPTGDGILDYSPWLGHSYWDFVWQEGMEPGTHWCAPQDGVRDSIRQDTNGGALHVRIGFNAKKGGSLDITLFPENSL